MAGGELEAVFKALAEDTAQAGKDIGESMARFTEITADTEDGNVARTLAADAETARAAEAIGTEEARPGVQGDGAPSGDGGDQGGGTRQGGAGGEAGGRAQDSGAGAQGNSVQQGKPMN